MYDKPIASNGGTKQRETGQNEDGASGDGSAAAKAFTGPSQYSLLGNDKYENVDLNEIQKAP